jgi:hypothetical protein
MKQSARKSSQLALVPPAIEQPDPPVKTSAPSLKEFFDGWLHSVSTTVITSPADPVEPESKKVFGKRPLTSTDVTRVNRATVRESTDHRHWPPEVVQKFIVADVIKRKSGRRSI